MESLHCSLITKGSTIVWLSIDTNYNLSKGISPPKAQTSLCREFVQCGREQFAVLFLLVVFQSGLFICRSTNDPPGSANLVQYPRTRSNSRKFYLRRSGGQLSSGTERLSVRESENRSPQRLNNKLLAVYRKAIKLLTDLLAFGVVTRSSARLFEVAQTGSDCRHSSLFDRVPANSLVY